MPAVPTHWHLLLPPLPNTRSTKPCIGGPRALPAWLVTHPPAVVPAAVQDHVWQPYESDGVLPYPEFSIRLGVADVPHIVPLLRGVSEQRLRAMRLAMVRYHR